MGVGAGAEAVVGPVGAVEAYAARAMRGGIENNIMDNWTEACVKSRVQKRDQ